MKTGKIFTAQARYSQTITNGAGQSLQISTGETGTFQTIPGAFVSNQILVEAKFGGKTIHFNLRRDPSVSDDKNLSIFLTDPNVGKAGAQFIILPPMETRSPVNSNADGTPAPTMSALNKAILTTASAAGSIGLLGGLWAASKHASPTWKTYVGHGLLGLIVGVVAGGVVTAIVEPTESSSGADGSCTGCAKRINTAGKFDI